MRLLALFWTHHQHSRAMVICYFFLSLSSLKSRVLCFGDISPIEPRQSNENDKFAKKSRSVRLSLQYIFCWNDFIEYFTRILVYIYVKSWCTMFTEYISMKLKYIFLPPSLLVPSKKNKSIMPKHSIIHKIRAIDSTKNSLNNCSETF